MKRIIYFLLSVVFIIGCDDYEYKQTNPDIEIKKSQLDFSAKGGEGYILVESSSNTISAKSNTDWCQVNVVDKKINVTVGAYGGIENRTAVVTITSDKDIPLNIPVTQTAAQFIIKDFYFVVDFVGTVVKTSVISEGSISVSTTDTWIDVKYEKDSIFITAQFNNTPEIRSGTVEVTSLGITQTIIVQQKARGLLFEDLLGDWEMTYYSSKTSTTPLKKDLVFSISQTTGFYDVLGLDLGAKMKIKFNSSSRVLEIYAGHAMGPDPGNSSNTLVMFMVSLEGYITWYDEVYYKGIWNNSFENISFTFTDSKVWEDNTVCGLYIVSSKSIPVVSGSYSFKYVNYNISMKKK